MVERFSGEWRSVNFDDVIVPKARIGWQGLRKDEYLWSGYSYLISGTDFRDGTISLDNIWQVSKARYDMDRNIQVKEGDVLVTKDGTIGKVAIVPKLPKPATLNSGVFVFRTHSGLIQPFLFRVLQSHVFREFINTLAAGSTIKHLYQKDLRHFSFMMPPLDEQIAIAETLSAFDLHLANLSELIAKHEGIRAGALEDLLSGRTRLPGFSGEWRTVKLGEISNYGKAKQVTSDNIPAGSLIVEMEDIEQAGACRLSIKHYDRRPKSAKNKFYPGDVLFGKMRTYLRKSWLADEEGYCSTEIVPFRGNEGVDSKFLMYVMITPQIVNWTKHMSAGMDMPRLGTKEALNLCVTLPPLDEQIAIAETLSALDFNITNLKAEHAKISALRTAAINDLLTAKTRLERSN